MSNTGSEPPYEPIQSEHESSFFAPGGTAVFIDPASLPYDGDEALDGEADELDSEFAPQPRRRLGKLTVLLAALLVAGGGFLAGIQVQKHQTTTPSAAALAARRGATGTGGAGGTGFGGFGGGGTGTGGRTGAGGTGTGTGGTGTGSGGTGTGSGGTGTGSGGTGTGAAAGSIPAVIGQIVSVTGDTVIVKNLGGKMVTVKLSAGTTITQAATTADLKPGQNVTVSGTTGSDGTVTATTLGTH